jgi:hypothetical protein
MNDNSKGLFFGFDPNPKGGVLNWNRCGYDLPAAGKRVHLAPRVHLGCHSALCCCCNSGHNSKRPIFHTDDAAVHRPECRDHGRRRMACRFAGGRYRNNTSYIFDGPSRVEAPRKTWDQSMKRAHVSMRGRSAERASSRCGC